MIAIASIVFYSPQCAFGFWICKVLESEELKVYYLFDKNPPNFNSSSTIQARDSSKWRAKN